MIALFQVLWLSNLSLSLEAARSAILLDTSYGFLLIYPGQL
jgi:hypothetical protein